MQKKYQKILFLIILVSQYVIAQQQNNHQFNNTASFSSDNYKSLTFNGIWCWFSDPRAVYHEGEYKRTYTGWVDNYGDIHIAYYDHDTQKVDSHVVYDNLEIDDHNNPSILFDEDGHLLVFFNTHSGDNKPLYMVKSENPERINRWLPTKELFLNDKKVGKKEEGLTQTYTNPVRLASENGKIYLFWRGIDLKPMFSFSENNGDSWSLGKTLFLPEETHGLKTPYTKVYSNGNSKIHFTFTNGHPAKEKTASIYYMYYENGKFYKANGQKIKDVKDLPVLESELDLIYDGKTEKSSAWNWDIAEDKKGNPVIVYAKFPDTKNHIYSYSIWKNNMWIQHDIVNSGGWFPETQKGRKEPAPNYSGGITIDHESPNKLYLSVERQGVFEIEEWITSNDGKTWEVNKITSGSHMNNVRPFAVRGAKKGNPLQVLWVQNANYIYYSTDTKDTNLVVPFKDRFHTAIKTSLVNKTYNVTLDEDTLVSVMQQLLDWQLAHNSRSIEYLKRNYGQFYAGIEAFYDVTTEQRYKNELINLLQYERNEDEEDEGKAIEDIFWSYNLKENRTQLEYLENLNQNNLKALDAAVVLSGLAHITPLLEDDQIDKDLIKKIFIDFSESVLTEKQKKGLWQANTMMQIPISKEERTALLVYSLAWGIQQGWIDKSHQQKLETSLKRLLELASKGSYKNSNTLEHSWNMQTTGAYILATKEMLSLMFED